MKLQAYTPEQTDELLENIKLICKYTVDVNKAAVEVFDKKYKEYLYAFYPGIIFKRKPLSRTKFMQECFWNENRVTSVYDPEKSYFAEHRFFKENFPNSFEYCRFSPMLRYFDKHFTKYGVDGWSEEEKEILNSAAGTTYFFFEKYKFREWYAILVKYAHRPFEFDKDDIETLEFIEYKIAKAKEFYKVSE